MENINYKYHNLVLSGGSIRGISQIGAVQKLVDSGIINLSSLKAVAGSSAGSMLGVLIVLGFTIDEIWDFMYNLDLAGMVKPDLFNLFNKFGMDTGKIIYNFFEDIIYKTTGVKHINFQQLYEITGIHLTITGSCLTTKSIVYFDHINTPTFKVSMAMRISISMPGFFSPITIDNNVYIDGAILNDYPINLFNNDIDNTIGIRIDDKYDIKYNYIEEYIMAIIKLFIYSYYEKSRKFDDNTVTIINNLDNVNIFNFEVDHDTKAKLFQIGYDTCTEFLNSKYN